MSTIASIATPVGTGAIGMIRLSGSDSISIAEGIFCAYNNNTRLGDIPGYSGVLGRLMRGQEPLDEVVVFIYRAPKSYTGEDIVEICCHGGAYLVKEALRLCLSAGARPALPGEFTKRAFLAGKMNIAQAEAIQDLIMAQSEGARKAAFAAKGGVLSTAIGFLVEEITAQSAYLAAWIDYPDEDIAEVNRDEIKNTLVDCKGSIEGLLSSYDRGRIIRDGISVTIAGKPNVGKSTLMNLLAGENRSIVTDIPGTTRDVVEERIAIGDHMLILCDTAGICDSADLVENKGIELARDKIQSSELVLAVFDGSSPLDNDDEGIIELLNGERSITIINKSDLPQKIDAARIAQNAVRISAATGSGRDELEAAILSALSLYSFDASAPIVANERQRSCLIAARDSLGQAIDSIDSGITLDAVCVCIDEALDSLLALTGQSAGEKVIDEVFARFCVGK